MTRNSSYILIRTQAAIRILKRLDKMQQEKLKSENAELALIERILTEGKTPGTLLDILSETLQSALDTINRLIAKGDGS